MKKRSSEPKETTLQIRFANEAAAHHFALWLCNSFAEQEYWNWMEDLESLEEGDITVCRFHYHGEDHNGEFLCDNVIRTTCGRIGGS